MSPMGLCPRMALPKLGGAALGGSWLLWLRAWFTWFGLGLHCGLGKLHNCGSNRRLPAVSSFHPMLDRTPNHGISNSASASLAEMVVGTNPKRRQEKSKPTSSPFWIWGLLTLDALALLLILPTSMGSSPQSLWDPTWKSAAVLLVT